MVYNWHLHLKFYWFHLNHFSFVDYWFLWSIFHENTIEFYFFGGGGGDFLIDKTWTTRALKICALLHHQCHVLRKCHSKTNFMISMISVSIWRRFTYGALAGVAYGVLLFRRPTTRCASIAFGVGAGLGSAHAECSQILGIDMPQWFSIVPKWPQWKCESYIISMF